MGHRVPLAEHTNSICITKSHNQFLSQQRKTPQTNQNPEDKAPERAAIYAALCGNTTEVK